MLNPKRQFAKELFDLYPDFIPTQALYLDLEGRQNGSEDILSMYWPALRGSERFSWFKQDDSTEINSKGLEAYLKSNQGTSVDSVVVYSGGQESPDERTRLTGLLDYDPFPNSTWINLLHVVQQCREMKGSIREHRNVWYGRDQIRVRYSLEALEWEFGIERPASIRSHSNRYKDLDGGSGQMKVLANARLSISGAATEDEERSLREYCEADVKNMFEIAYASERLLFTRNERRNRRKLHS
jgi:hypothetical protein